MSFRVSQNVSPTLVEQIPIVAYVLEFGDPSSIVYCSPQIEDILGYPPEVYEEDPAYWINVVHPDDRERVLAEDALVASTGETFDIEYRCLARDGRTVWMYDKASVERDKEGRPQYRRGVMLDITARKAFEEQLIIRAFHDPLTGLSNRVLFMERLEHALARTDRHGKSIAALFLDLDDFKLVNDSFGHDVGDQLLGAVAGRLRACVRPEDTVARMGGDEFTVLLEDLANATDAEFVAERIIERLQAPFLLEDREVYVSASIGIASSVFAQDQPSGLLKRADLALYEAKRNNKARYKVFEEKTGAGFGKRPKPEEELYRALEREEFAVYYQPVVALETGAIVGVEALVRWKHPERGLILPGAFIPLAERTGLIAPLGRWVLREACEQMASWQRCYPGMPLTTNVNLSAKQIRQPQLAEEIAEILEETGFDPGKLILDLAEETAVDEEGFVKLHDLKDLGVQLDIDDFGTGYFSLPCLKRLPVDALKIDCSFAWGIGRSREGKAIVAATADLAHALDQKAVAETVETKEQLDHLLRLGFKQAQGNYFMRPLPSSEVSALLAAGRVV